MPKAVAEVNIIYNFSPKLRAKNFFPNLLEIEYCNFLIEYFCIVRTLKEIRSQYLKKAEILKIKSNVPCSAPADLHLCYEIVIIDIWEIVTL